MNENDVIRNSYKLFIVGSVIFVVVSLLTRDISYLLGFILGFIINTLVFQVIIKMCDSILELSVSSTIIVVLTFVLKLILYAIGFIIAVKSPYIHIIGVFFGYMITKLSIYTEGYKSRRR